MGYVLIIVLSVGLPLAVCCSVAVLWRYYLHLLQQWEAEYDEESYITEPIPEWLSQDQIDVLFTKRALEEDSINDIIAILKGTKVRTADAAVDEPSCVICLDASTVAETASDTSSPCTAVSNDPCTNAPYAADTTRMHPASSCSSDSGTTEGDGDAGGDSVGPASSAIGGSGSSGGGGGGGGGGVRGPDEELLVPVLCKRNYWCHLPCGHYFHAKCLEVWIRGEGGEEKTVVPFSPFICFFF